MADLSSFLLGDHPVTIGLDAGRIASWDICFIFVPNNPQRCAKDDAIFQKFSRSPLPPLMADVAHTITVRAVRSFEYKTVRNLYFHDLDLANTTLAQLKAMCDEKIQTSDNLKFMAAVPFDTFKIYSQPHGAKTSNPVINLIDDETLILADWSKSLGSLGFQNETEVSLFVMADYLKYKENPVFKW